MNFKDRDWRRLLRDIADYQVVPVVGPELLEVEFEGKKTTLYRHLAEQLVARFDIDDDELPERYELHDVVAEFLQQPKADADELYFEIRDITNITSWSVPESLRKLAEITQFDIFISTTFDSLMEQALNEVRFAGEAGSNVIAYGKKSEVADLPDGFRPGTSATLFQFFGRINPLHDFAVTEEDVLEYAYRLQSRYHRPNNLFDLLRNKNLLTLGCGFPGWLTRFFFAATKGEQLFSEGVRGALADNSSLKNQSLVMFLERQKTNVYSEGDATAFIDELHRRWLEEPAREAAPESTTITAPSLPAAPAPSQESSQEHTPLPAAQEPQPPQEPDAVFISYHSGDRTLAEKVAKAFEDAGVAVWFDAAALISGDDYRAKIERNIERSSYFFPLISQNSIQPGRRFFRLEWRKAIDETNFREPEYPFIQPIIIDDTSPVHEGIPHEFRQVHCQWLKDLPELVELTKKRIRELRRSGRAA